MTALDDFLDNTYAPLEVYTQTYAIADRTHADPTAAAVATPAAALAAFGYSQTQANSIPVAINALIADLAAVKQVLNALIDDLQTARIVG